MFTRTKWMNGYYRVSNSENPEEFAGIRHEGSNWKVEIRNSLTGNFLRYGSLERTLKEATHSACFEIQSMEQRRDYMNNMSYGNWESIPCNIAKRLG